MDGSSWQRWRSRILRLFGNDFEATLDLPVGCLWSTSQLESLRHLAVTEGWEAAQSVNYPRTRGIESQVAILAGSRLKC
jgi:hypothetical protein